MNYIKLVIYIVLILFVFSIVGCGNGNKNNTSIATESDSHSSTTKIVESQSTTSILPASANSDNASSTVSDSSKSSTDSAIVPANKTTYKIYSGVEIDSIRKEKEDAIARKSLEEYKNVMLKLQRQFSYYDLTIASIKKNMIQNFWYEDNAFNWQQNTIDATKYVDNIPEYSPIYSGISLDDIHFIALSQPTRKESQKYSDVVNKIIGEKNETDFLSGFNNLANSKGYYALDIYVDDLLCLDRRISIDGIKFTLDGSIDIKNKQMENLSISTNDISLNNYLKKYNREVNYSKELKNKSWNLFLFKKRELQPYSILISLKTYNNEFVELKK